MNGQNLYWNYFRRADAVLYGHQKNAPYYNLMPSNVRFRIIWLSYFSVLRILGEAPDAIKKFSLLFLVPLL